MKDEKTLERSATRSKNKEQRHQTPKPQTHKLSHPLRPRSGAAHARLALFDLDLAGQSSACLPFFRFDDLGGGFDWV
jgi:hypothetical protein